MTRRLDTVEPVRVALLGCGRIAQAAHLPAMAKADGVDVVAVADPSADVARLVSQRFGVPHWCTDLDELLAIADCEAVVVTAPDRFHHQLATQALHAGRHVLVEKPMTASVAEATALADVVAATGLVLQVGAMKRHDAGLQYARRFVADSLGDLRSFNAWYRIGDMRSGIEATLFPPLIADEVDRLRESEFKADRQRYLLATHGAHVFDTVRFLCGDIVAVTARHRADGRDHAWQILATTATGAVGTITLTVDVPGAPTEGIECFGSNGSVRVDTPFPFYRQSSNVAAYCDGQTVVPTLTDGDAYERQIEAFAAAVRGQATVTPDVHDGLAAVRLIAAVGEAVSTGAEVPV
jgi:predicted dehydrogenase